MKNNTVYLVTGAAGFLGSTVVRQLVERGDHVRAFVLPGDKSARYLPDEAEIVYGDLTSRQDVDSLFEVPEGMESVCLHIGAIVSINPEYNPKVMEVNVGGTEHIIDACLTHPECRRLVYCGSTGSLIETPRGTKIKEQDRYDETRVEGCYSMSKAMAAQKVLDAVHEKGLNACIVLPSGIMGPDDYAIGETTGSLIRIINGELKAGIAGSFNLVDARDLADGILRAVELGRSGESYILSNEEITFRQFADLICSDAGAKPIRMFLSLTFAKVMAAFMEGWASMTGTKPLMTDFAVYNLLRNNDFDCTKAKEELGYHTRSAQETIHDEVVWLKNTGRISSADKREPRSAMAH